MDLRRVVTADQMRFVPVATHEIQQLGLRDTGQDSGIGDLVLVQGQDRHHRPVPGGIDELIAVPTRCQRTGLGLTVADHTEHGQVRVVEGRAVRVHQRVTQLATFVKRSRRLRCTMARHPTRIRELPEERRHPLLVPGSVAVQLRIRAFQPCAGVRARTTMPRTGNENGAQPACQDLAVRVCPHQVQARDRAEMTEQPGLDVLRRQRLAQQRIRPQVDLADGQIVRRSPPRVDQLQLTAIQRAGYITEHVRDRGDRLTAARALVVRRRVSAHARQLLLHQRPSRHHCGRKLRPLMCECHPETKPNE
jgi:hypothetical protein